jgi:demethylmacrocin O-methyltransferase
VSLKDLAIKYASDKLYWHSYVEMYEKLFEGLEVKRLLEIGIGYADLMKPFLPEGVSYVHGSSLYMWQEYFPEAEIFACDIREGTLVNEGRIHSMVCDQSDEDSLFNLAIKFGIHYDVIIDDGSHQHEHQRLTASILLPAVRKGGLYIVEDVWPPDGLKLASEFGGYLIAGEKGRDDNMVVIQK